VNPSLSIVIATRDMARETASCLVALEPQARPPTEVLVADGSRDGSAELIERQFPWVRVVRGRVGAGLAELRATGLAEAHGDVIAFTDPHGQVSSNWVERLRAAPWQRFAAVGGVVAPPSCRCLSDWAAFLCEYGPHLPSQPPGPAMILPGNNVGFRHEALERAGLIGEREFWKTFVLWRLARRGERFWVDPCLVVHRRRTTAPLAFIRERYLHGRCFGANRAAHRSQPYRLARALSCLVVPELHTTRLIQTVSPDVNYRGALWRSLPYLAAFNAAWALGELIGYLLGGGDACSQLN
jgi:glycosyltransferase involved in cell wall biosynthesis